LEPILFLFEADLWDGWKVLENELSILESIAGFHFSVTPRPLLLFHLISLPCLCSQDFIPSVSTLAMRQEAV
jgi:hypothetical protein